MESTYFSDFISDKFLSRLTQKLNIDIRFEKIKIRLTPLALEFENITVKKEDIYKNAFGRFDSLRLDFDAVDLLTKNKVSIEHIKLKKGLFSYQDKKRNTNKEFKNLEDIFNEIIKLQDTYPTFSYSKNKISIYALSLDEIDLIHNKSFATVQKSNLWRSKRGWHLNLMASELSSNLIKYDLEKIDSITGNFSLVNKEVILNKVTIIKKLDELELSGKVSLFESRLSTEAKIKFYGDAFKILRDHFPKEKELVGVEGFTKINASVNIKDKKYSLKGNVELQDFLSKYVNGDSLKVSFTLNDELISIRDFTYQNGEGKLKTNSSFKLFDITKNEFVVDVINVNTNNLSLEDALFVVPELKPLKGNLNGNIDIIFSNEKVLFYGQDGLRLNDFALKFDSPTPVLTNPALNIPKLEVSIFPNFDVGLDVGVAFPGSDIKAKGIISKNVSISTYNSFLDLESLGPISGTILKGRGPIKLMIEGDEDVELKFKSSPEGFSVLGLNFGRAISNFSYKTGENKLLIPFFESKVGGSEINGKGDIDFENKSKLNLDIKLSKANVNDTENILERFFKKRSLIPRALYIQYDSVFKVFGEAENNDVKVKGVLNTNNLKLMQEELDSFRTDFLFEKESLYLNNFKLKKKDGLLEGKISYNFKTDYVDYALDLSKAELIEFKYYTALNLGLNGMLYGSFTGEGVYPNLSASSILELKDSVVGDVSLPSSKIDLILRDKNLFGNFRLFGTVGQGQLSLNFDKELSRRSEFNFDLSSNDLGILTGVISESNLIGKNVSGRVKLNMTGDFNLFDMRDINAEVNLERFTFKKNKLNYKLNPNRNKILIEKGNFSKWGIEVLGDKQYFTSQGTGSMNSEFRVENKFILDGELLEIIGPSFKKVRGLINGKINFFGNYKKINPDIVFNGEEVSLNSSYVPGVFAGINFKTSLNKKEIIIHNINGKYNGGDFKSDGVILFRFPFPLIKLNFSLNNTKFAVMKKSSFVVSGTGKIEGDKTPYELYGNLYIPFGKINDSLNELLKTRGVTDDFSIFLPGKRDLEKLELLKLNLNIDITKPVIIRNNISELSFQGKLNAYNYPSNPLVKGNLEFSPNVSKFIFKGNEFKLTEGRINFIENEIKLDPEFTFVGVSKINEYDIRISAKGRGRDLDFKLSSEPSLSQEDILSLLTIGVTTQTSKSLQAKDRESLTSIGIGSLIMDQFQINEGLSSTLGLRLSLTPEFSDETEIDPLSSRTSSTGGATSKVRSATRIKIKKKITDKLDMSLSSTVGGSIEQKQEMNVDYNINKNILLQGIYEVKSTNEQESSEDPTSLGADIRFRWFFK